MQRAGVAAPEWPAELNHDDLADVVLGDLLRSQYWLLAFDHDMRVQLTPVPFGATVQTHEQREAWRMEQASRVMAAVASGLKGVGP
ncbi:MAG: hypothetical protein GAK31_00958 [Stenotrophomonas maltophilia]|uniref:Uncharacterized protein n=1 Tax=Stenotrophomonas maltophilia TaxID=40324 RepID=A0A7V8FKA9_STEMA|nr:MAG: hypothetical protein GAK31_00958 [Stenotrophomonas maltophilia]